MTDPESPAEPAPLPPDLAPDGPGATFWRKATTGFGFDGRPDEELLLVEVCHLLDRLPGLRSDPRAERLAQEQLRRLLRAIKWGEGEGEDGPRSISEWGRRMAQKRWHDR